MFEWEIDRRTDDEAGVGNYRPQLDNYKPQLDSCKPQLGHVEIVYIPRAGYIDATSSPVTVSPAPPMNRAIREKDETRERLFH